MSQGMVHFSNVAISTQMEYVTHVRCRSINFSYAKLETVFPIIKSNTYTDNSKTNTSYLIETYSYSNMSYVMKADSKYINSIYQQFAIGYALYLRITINPTVEQSQ